MDQPLIPLLHTLDRKISKLADINQGLHARIESLEEENQNLRLELEEMKSRLKQAETDAQFLTMSHRLAQSPDTIISTRRHIARLIRNIDKCISMLKEE